MQPRLRFTPLATPNRRWKSFLIGWGLQVQLVLAVVLLNAILPNRMQPVKRYVVTDLVAPATPVIQDPQRVSPRAVQPARQRVLDTPAVTKLVVPRQVGPTRQPEPDVKPPQVQLPSKTPDLPRLPNLPIAKVVATNGFATPTSGITTTSKPAALVQTGGFGDPNGIPTSDGNHGVNIAAKGNPSLPQAAGFGDGLGSTGGVRGVGIVGKGIQSSGFDKQYEAPVAKQSVMLSNEANSPVEIIEKPEPSYTEEARKLGVQGEVRLEVQFTADGHIRVLRVLQGLGFGLDEQALHCAQHIRFKPATHGGQPIDSRAVVHIVFALAS